MRRIYASDALYRDDDDRFTPAERQSGELQAMRSVNGTALSRRLVPYWLRHRAVSVEVSTPRTEYALGDPVPFRVTMRNSMPFPITLRTRSPRLWTWSVDGATDAARVSVRDSPNEPGEFRFDRGERKHFTKRWEQAFRVSEREWERVSPGEFTISAGFNVDDVEGKGLYDEVTIRIIPKDCGRTDRTAETA